jgi:hypothetical protein
VGHPPVQAVPGAIAVEWSEDAPADLDRFAQFLQADNSELASIIAGEILSRIQLFSDSRPEDTTREPAIATDGVCVKDSSESVEGLLRRFDTFSARSRHPERPQSQSLRRY